MIGHVFLDELRVQILELALDTIAELVGGIAMVPCDESLIDDAFDVGPLDFLAFQGCAMIR